MWYKIKAYPWKRKELIKNYYWVCSGGKISFGTMMAVFIGILIVQHKLEGRAEKFGRRWLKEAIAVKTYPWM